MLVVKYFYTIRLLSLLHFCLKCQCFRPLKPPHSHILFTSPQAVKKGESMCDSILIYLKFNTVIFQMRKIFTLLLNSKMNLLQMGTYQYKLINVFKYSFQKNRKFNKVTFYFIDF